MYTENALCRRRLKKRVRCFFFICLRLFEQNGMEYILIYGRRIVGVVVGRLLRIYSTIIKYISKYARCHRRAPPAAAATTGF